MRLPGRVVPKRMGSPVVKSKAAMRTWWGWRRAGTGCSPVCTVGTISNPLATSATVVYGCGMDEPRTCVTCYRPIRHLFGTTYTHLDDRPLPNHQAVPKLAHPMDTDPFAGINEDTH